MSSVNGFLNIRTSSSVLVESWSKGKSGEPMFNSFRMPGRNRYRAPSNICVARRLRRCRLEPSLGTFVSLHRCLESFPISLMITTCQLSVRRPSMQLLASMLVCLSRLGALTVLEIYIDAYSTPVHFETSSTVAMQAGAA